MGDYVIFQMWGPFRHQLISNHKFYVEQASKRLLSQFADIGGEADQFAAKWLEERQHLFDPDRRDPSDFDEQAYDESIAFFGLLTDMLDSTRLNIIAGMFHEWDKQLRDWLSLELAKANVIAGAKSAIWKVDFVKIIDLLECLNWPVPERDYFATLNACRLVVNVYKHGLGISFNELKANHPQFFRNNFGGALSAVIANEYLDYTDIKTTDQNLEEFSNAIIAFWQDVPENTFQSQITSIPSWLSKAIAKEPDAKNEKDH